MTDTDHSLVAEAAAEATAATVDSAIQESALAAEAASVQAAEAQATADSAVSVAAEVATEVSAEATVEAAEATETATAAAEGTLAVAVEAGQSRSEFETFREETRAHLTRLEGLLREQREPQVQNTPEIVTVGEADHSEPAEAEGGESTHERVQRHKRHRFGR